MSHLIKKNMLTVEEKEHAQIRKTAITFIIIIALIAISLLYGCPKYKVYSQRMDGEAELARAISSKQVATQEALAKKESAKDLAAADTIRAHGLARSNQIIGKSLENNDGYLKWLWIDEMGKNPNAVFYVPTENSLPLMMSAPKPIQKEEEQ